jgi:hypothetical protein
VEDAVDQRRWANTSIGSDAHFVLETLQAGLTVNLISTKRSDFVTCTSDEELSIVVNRNRQNQFDFLPVIETLESPNRIVGLIEIASLNHGAKIDGLVRAKMQTLSERNLFGADASILAFLRTADSQRCRLIVSGHEISGQSFGSSATTGSSRPFWYGHLPRNANGKSNTRRAWSNRGLD